MKKEELDQYLGKFGMITVRHNGWKKEIHGKPKEIDAEDMLLFKDTSRCLRKFKLIEIIDFQEKEMLPAPTEHKGHPVTWDGGRWINRWGKTVEFDR